MLHLAPVALLALFSTSEWSSQQLSLEVDLSPLSDLEAERYRGAGEETFGLQKAWHGKRGKTELWVEFWTLDKEDYRLSTPEDVCSLNYHDLRERRGDPQFMPDGHRLVSGSVGDPAYACIDWGTSRAKRGRSGAEPHQHMQAAGVTPKGAWCFEVRARPALPKAERDKLLTSLVKSVHYKGEVRPTDWTDEEAEARWRAATPEKLHKKLTIKRTKHFIILTNSAAYKQCAKKLEQFHEQIRKLYPFEDVKGQRLLPVFLFRQRKEYLDFCEEITGQSREQAEASAGHAWKDYYATTFASPRDPTHLHEITHQLFDNRMNLGSGGSWFQEGVAEYISEPKNHIISWSKRVAKRKQHEPFARFMTVGSLLGDARSEQQGSDRYVQAASMIKYLAESKRCKAKFDDFVYQMGSVRYGDAKAMQGVLQDLYNMDIPAFEAAWIEYWKRGGRD